MNGWLIIHLIKNLDQLSPGDIRFKDIYTTPEDGSFVSRVAEGDNRIDQFDRQYLGKQIPGYFGGANLAIDYKGWDLNANFRFVGDVQTKNGFRRSAAGILAAGGTNATTDFLGRWTADNPSNSIQSCSERSSSGNSRFSG